MELQRVGNEGAKVLRELGKRVKTTTKLRPGDILSEVHEAAEELQKKIDRRSYLLVNAECWEIGNRQRIPDTETLIRLNSMEEGTNNYLPIKSSSEAVLDLRYVQVPKSWNAHDLNSGFGSSILGDNSSESVIQKQLTWPVRRSFVERSGKEEREDLGTYESASALSLATFSSLLIEFVARLQNLVDSFVELGEVAGFSDAVDERPPS